MLKRVHVKGYQSADLEQPRGRRSEPFLTNAVGKRIFVIAGHVVAVPPDGTDA